MDMDYLNRANQATSKGFVDFCTTNNFDEAYEDIFPEISSHELWRESINYDLSFLGNTERKIQDKFNLSQVILGSGIEELIIRLRVLALKNSWKICITEPYFYRTGEILTASAPRIVNQNNINVDFPPYKLVLLTNPNPLNGHIFESDTLLGIFKKHPDTIFIVDEASMFTVPNWEKYSLLPHTKFVKNLLVFSSLSKMYGIPSQRVAFASGNLDILKLLKEVGPTFPIPATAAFIANTLLEQDNFIRLLRDKIQIHKAQIESLIKKYKEMDILVQTPINCLFIQPTNDQTNLYDKLLKSGIMGLDVSEYFPQRHCIRITIHSSEKRHEFLINRLRRVISLDGVK